MLTRHKLVMSPDGGDGGANGGGAANSGAANSGAGGGGQGAGGTGTGGGSGLLTGTQPNGAGADPAGGNKTPANSGGAGDSQVVYPENWKMGLPKELQENSALSVIKDIPGLVKSYISAQAMIGAEKIAVPGKNATAEEMRAIYNKLGLPQDAKEYKIEGVKDGMLPKEFVDSFAGKAFEIGILPAQAQALTQWMEETNKANIEKGTTSFKTNMAQEVEKLRTEYGDAFDNKIMLAQAAVKHFGSEEISKYLVDSGLTDNPQLVRLFAKVGEVLKEDGIIKEPGTGSSAMTPQAAQVEINKVLSNTKHPYYIKEHPEHAEAVRLMTTYFEATNPKARK